MHFFRIFGISGSVSYTHLKSKKETEYECILRHIRNAIAHSNVYIYQTGNRKYICFTDFNKTGKQSAMILLSQTDLSNLKKELMK